MQARILQNQEGFSTEDYRSRATPLVVALERRGVPLWIGALRRNGFAAGALMYLCAGEYDAIVTVSHRPAIVYGLLNRIAPRKRSIHVAKEFFFEVKTGKGGSLKKRLLTALYRFSLKNVDAVIVNASGEITPYARQLGIPEDRFIFIEWPSNIDQPCILEENDGSLFAAGRSLRDWKTLFMAVDGLPIHCVVVATRADVADLRVPENVELHCDITHGRYLEFLKRAKIVVVPLLETKRSTGQASFLEAMAYGKPVIVTGVTGVWDYISDRRTGLIFRPGDAADLRRAIDELNGDEGLRNVIVQGGFDAVVSRFCKQRYASDMLKTIDLLHAARTASVSGMSRS